MRILFILLCLTALPVSAESELVSIRYKGRVEHYWIMYKSADGKLTKVSNAQSGIHFFIETAHLNSIVVARHKSGERTIRVRKRE